jgi:Mn2+/Fe2+ NRAMP family transporter
MPDVGALATGTVVPVLPVGAALLVGGLLGYMPAPIELAIIESLWFKEKGIPADEEGRRRKMREALLDFRVGYVTSVLLGLLLLALGAALLNPRGLVPAGTAVFTTITEIYRTTLGPSVVPIYLLGAFLGMFATSYGVLDGFPRSLSASLTAAGRPAPVTRRGRDVRYWYFLYAMFLLGLGAAILLPNPALLVSLAATGTVILGPLWYGLIVATTHRLPEPFRPTRRDRIVAWLGLAGMIATAVYVAYINLVPS